MTTHETLQKFKKGTPFVITKRPTQWASTLNINCPFDDKVKYPYYGIVVNIEFDKAYFAINDGYYGWSLSCLLREDKIFNQQEIRKEKLEKLNDSTL